MSHVCIFKTVAASATPERLSATDVFVDFVRIGSFDTNTGNAFIADSQAKAAAGTGWHLLVSVNSSRIGIERYFATPISLKNLWAAVSVNGEGVWCLYRSARAAG